MTTTAREDINISKLFTFLAFQLLKAEKKGLLVFLEAMEKRLQEEIEEKIAKLHEKHAL